MEYSAEVNIESIEFREDLIDIRYLNNENWEKESILFRKEEFEQWLKRQKKADLSSYWDNLKPHDWNKTFYEEKVYQDIALYFNFKLSLENLVQNAWPAGNRLNPDEELVDLLSRAVATIEEVYEKDFELLHEDNAYDYKEMIETLNRNGYNYNGKDEIIALTKAPDFWQMQDQKKPMKRATGRKKAANQKEAGKRQERRFGS